ncbi:MAG: hypothetical protein WAZ98_03460 [Cyclobacteriaceae bacterium]
MRIFLSGLIAFCLVACQKREERSVVINEQLFENGRVSGELKTSELEESSGLTESFQNRGLLWVLNDGGDQGRIYLIDTTAQIKARVLLEGIKNRDWEDMASGPGPEEGKKYIYVGDIGDNDAKHKFKFIYRIEEPEVDLLNSPDTTVTKVDCIKFQLPDGSRDAESMMIDPLTRDIYIISKREQKVNLYRLPYPQSTSEVITAELALKKLEFNQYQGKIISNDGGQTLINGYHSAYYNQVVSCDISGDGREMLIKSYSAIYYWSRQENESIVDMIQRVPTLLPYTPEPQGEAITFNEKKSGYYTLNESLGKQPQQLLFYRRK